VAMLAIINPRLIALLLLVIALAVNLSAQSSIPELERLSSASRTLATSQHPQWSVLSPQDTLPETADSGQKRACSPVSAAVVRCHPQPRWLHHH